MNNLISIVNTINTNKALSFAQLHGIVEYKIINNRMVYYVSYPQYLANKRYTIKYVVNLKDMTEERLQLSRYNKRGEYNN